MHVGRETGKNLVQNACSWKCWENNFQVIETIWRSLRAVSKNSGEGSGEMKLGCTEIRFRTLKAYFCIEIWREVEWCADVDQRFILVDC